MALQCEKCGKKLRAPNKGPFCFRCGLSSGGGKRRAGTKRRSKIDVSVDTESDFMTLTEALGFDADELLNEYRARWLERVRSAVRKGFEAPADADEAADDNPLNP